MREAGVGIRAVAAIVDGVIAFVALGIPVAIATGRTYSDDGTHGFTLTGWPAALWLALFLAYYTVLEATTGATLGKRLAGLRVRTEDGGPIGWQEAVVRNLLRLVDGILFYLVAAIAVWTSRRNQRLGDRAARTVVVRT